MIRDHYTGLFSSCLEDQDGKKQRLYALEAQCSADHQNDQHHWIELPLHTVLETRQRLGSCRAAGSDQVVYEVFQYLSLETVDVVRTAFEARLNCLAGHTGLIPAWQKVLVHCIAKTANAHRPGQWRPLSLVCVLEKWYLACVCEVLNRFVPAFTCHLYGFVPGRMYGGG